MRQSSGAPSRRTAHVSDDVAEIMRAVRRAASVARGVDARGRRGDVRGEKVTTRSRHPSTLSPHLARRDARGWESGLGIVERANEMTHDARAAAVSARLREEVAVIEGAAGGDRDDDARGERGASARWRELRSRALERVGHHCYVDASTAGEGAGRGCSCGDPRGGGTVVASYPGLTSPGRRAVHE